MEKGQGQATALPPREHKSCAVAVTANPAGLKAPCHALSEVMLAASEGASRRKRQLQKVTYRREATGSGGRKWQGGASKAKMCPEKYKKT